MYEFFRNQTILAFLAPKLKMAQVILTITPLSTFLSKCRIFTHSTAIYPYITRRTVLKKRFKRIELKVCILISLCKKANSVTFLATYTCYITLTSTVYAVSTLATTIQAVRMCDNTKIRQYEFNIFFLFDSYMYAFHICLLAVFDIL